MAANGKWVLKNRLQKLEDALGGDRVDRVDRVGRVDTLKCSRKSGGEMGKFAEE